MHDRQVARRPGEGDVQSPEADWVVARYQLRFDDDGRIEFQPLRSRRRHEIDRRAEFPFGCVGEGNALSLQLIDDDVVKRLRADDPDEQPAAREGQAVTREAGPRLAAPGRRHPDREVSGTGSPRWPLTRASR